MISNRASNGDRTKQKTNHVIYLLFGMSAITGPTIVMEHTLGIHANRTGQVGRVVHVVGGKEARRKRADSWMCITRDFATRAVATDSIALRCRQSNVTNKADTEVSRLLTGKWFFISALTKMRGREGGCA